MNTVSLIGRLVKDLDLRYTQSGKGEPRGYCRALKDIEGIVRGMKQEGVTE